MRTVNVAPGTVAVSTHADEPLLLRTLLGSCVSMCVFDHRLRIGGMNHFLLPESQGERHGPQDAYAEHAIPHLLRSLKAAGSHPSDLSVKLLGGAEIVKAGHAKVGAHNVAYARKLLAEYKLSIDAEDLGGTKGRMVEFHSATGALQFRYLKGMPPAPLALAKPVPTEGLLDSELQPSHDQLAVIGASTGGPEVLIQLLSELPRDMPPIVVVQHMPAKFIPNFAKRLNSSSALEVKEAVDYERLYRGHTYIAPGSKQLSIHQLKSGELFLRVEEKPPVNGFSPSVSHLFSSVEKLVLKKCVALLLTGMGRDGAEELLVLRQRGITTVAQDEATSAVFGMPAVAISLGGVDHIAASQDLGHLLLRILAR